ncbi:MAG: hypothetical protein OER95_12475, partial [Acidimicrobiia bacterium]|nr:hypothetical protein [Acidimicrobiia bacterium]
VRSGEPFDDLPRLLLSDPGVYPIIIELRNDEGVIATTRSNMIRLPPNANEDPNPLKLSLVLPVVPAEGITIIDTQQLLTNHPDLPITVLLGEGVIPQFEDDPSLVDTFVTALGNRPLVANPIVNLDPSALAAIDRIGLYRQAVTDTTNRLRELGLQPDPTIAVVNRQLTAVGAQALIEMGIKVVIDASTSPAPNGYIDVGGKRLHLLRYDDTISAAFGELSSGVLQSNEAMSRLVVRGQANRSPVVVGGSGLGTRPTRGLNVFFHALARAGAPQPVLLPEAAVSTFERRPAEHPNQDLEPVASLIVDTQDLIAAFETMYSGGGTSPDAYLQQLQSALSLGRNPEDRLRSLVQLTEVLGRELEVISLPDAQPVTMAAREGSIPLVVESRAAGPRLVMLRFRSDKVNVKQDSQLLVVEPGTSSIDVEVEARSLGASQLEVAVWTPDGQRILASNQFEVRSTAVPGLGLLISVTAVVLLILWWYVDYRRSSARRVEKKAASIIARRGYGRSDVPASTTDGGDRQPVSAGDQYAPNRG